MTLGQLDTNQLIAEDTAIVKDVSWPLKDSLPGEFLKNNMGLQWAYSHVIVYKCLNILTLVKMYILD